jgi:hypothetical protein
MATPADFLSFIYVQVVILHLGLKVVKESCFHARFHNNIIGPPTLEV